MQQLKPVQFKCDFRGMSSNEVPILKGSVDLFSSDIFAFSSLSAAQSWLQQMFQMHITSEVFTSFDEFISHPNLSLMLLEESDDQVIMEIKMSDELHFWYQLEVQRIIVLDAHKEQLSGLISETCKQDNLLQINP